MITTVSASPTGHRTSGTIAITLDFSPSVDVSGSLSLPLNIMPSGNATVTMGASSNVSSLELNYTITSGNRTPYEVPLSAGLYDIALSGYIYNTGTSGAADLTLPDAGSGYCVFDNALFVDKAAPTVGVHSVTPAFGNSTTPVTAMLVSEPGLNSLTLALAGVAASATATASGLYTFTFVPTIAIPEGAVTGQVVAIDAYSNTTSAAISLPFYFDNTRPAAPVTATPLSQISTDGTLSFTLHSEVLTGSGMYGYAYDFSKDDFPYASGGITPTSGDAILHFSNLPSGTYFLEYRLLDYAGNRGTQSATGVLCTVYAEPLTGVLTGAPITNSSVAVSADFNGPISSFSSGGVLIKNARVSTITTGASGATFTIYPILPGYSEVQLDAGTAESPVGMPSSLTNKLEIYYDPLRPEVQLSSARQCTCINPLPLDVIFSKPVTGITTGDFTATNGLIDSVSGSGFNYTVYVTPASGAAAVTGGPHYVTVSVNASAGTDYAGNLSMPSTPLTVIYDDNAPTVLALHGEVNFE